MTPFFPFFLLLVKFLAIFNEGPQMTRLKNIVSLCEGQVESMFQLGLQVFIILYRADRKPSYVQLAALPISLLMIILGQTNAWYGDILEFDLVKDIKRKVKITPLLIMINLLFLGVPVVVLAMDKYVAIYNMVAAFGVIVITLLIRLCFFRKFMLSDLSNYLYLLSSLWLTALIIWATVEGNVNRTEYQNVSIVQNEYFNIITGVLIACNPVVWVIVIDIVCL